MPQLRPEIRNNHQGTGHYLRLATVVRTAGSTKPRLPLSPVRSLQAAGGGSRAMVGLSKLAVGNLNAVGHHDIAG